MNPIEPPYPVIHRKPSWKLILSQVTAEDTGRILSLGTGTFFFHYFLTQRPPSINFVSAPQVALSLGIFATLLGMCWECQTIFGKLAGWFPNDDLCKKYTNRLDYPDLPLKKTGRDDS